MPKIYFDERIAATYDETSADMFEPAVVDAIDVTIGDFATTRVDGTFRLAYLVFNTIGNLTTQDQQVACFANAAAHLEPGGCFVIEVGVPDLRRLPPGQDARVVLPRARLRGHRRVHRPGRADLLLAPLHADGSTALARVLGRRSAYVWPSELDLMAQLAGLSLRDRWAGWNRSPFTADSTSHVSVWEKAP